MKETTLDPLTPNQYAVITGAAGGLGTSFALACASRGYNLFLIDLCNENLFRLKDFIKRNYHVAVVCLEADLSEEGIEKKVLDIVQRERLKVNMLINCAGIGQNDLFEDADDQHLRKLIEVNTIACVMLTKALLPELKNNNRSTIINVSSLASYFALPRKSCYAATKGFVRQFSNALSAEVKKDGVTISVLCPGPITTNINNYVLHKQLNWFSRKMMQHPQVVAEMTVKKALKGKRIIIPGSINKMLRLATFIIPGFLQRQIVLYSMKQLERKKAKVKKIINPELEEVASISA